MARSPIQKLQLDFRPKSKRRWRAALVGIGLFALVCGGIWAWIAPWDRAERQARQLEVLSGTELEAVIAELIDSGPAGRHYACRVLGHKNREIRQIARSVWFERLAAWRMRPQNQPSEFSELTRQLPPVLAEIPVAERSGYRAWIDQWLAVADSSENPAKLRAEYTARRELLAFSQPPTESPAKFNDRVTSPLLIDDTSSASGQKLDEPGRLAISDAQTPLPSLADSIAGGSQAVVVSDDSVDEAAPQPRPILPPSLENETQTSAPRHEPHSQKIEQRENQNTSRNTAVANAQQATATANAPQALGAGKAIRQHPPAFNHSNFTQLAATPLDSERLQALIQAGDLLIRTKQAGPEERLAICDESLAAGWSRGDWDVWEQFCSATASQLTALVNDLPKRNEVDSQCWLRGFALHEAAAVRRAAYSWLLTAPDAETRAWLRTRLVQEGDPATREWLQQGLSAGERRAR